MDTGCSDAVSSSSHGVSWSNLTTPCCVQGSRQRHYSRSHDLQNENVLLLVIFQTYGVSSRHDGHSYVCSMGLWFLLHTVCCNCCKRSDKIQRTKLAFWQHCVAKKPILYAVFNSLILCSHICENTRTIAGPFLGLK